jgi:exonuclease III
MYRSENCVILNWNMRRLNNPTRCQVVKDLVFDHRSTLVCLQETKLQVMDSLTVASTLGPDFAQNYAVLRAIGTRRGLILACSQ